MEERNGPSEIEETRKMKYRRSKERKQEIEESGENKQDWTSGVVYKEQGQSTGVIDIGQCSIAAGLDSHTPATAGISYYSDQLDARLAGRGPDRHAG